MENKNPRTEAIRREVLASFEDLLGLVDGPLAQLDSSALYASTSSDEWTIMEILAHVIEFMPYWASQFSKVVSSPGQRFGRTVQDEQRLQGIVEHKNDSLAQAKTALAASYAQLDEMLGSLKDSDLELTAQDYQHGELTLARIINNIVTQHLMSHIKQLQAKLV